MMEVENIPAEINVATEKPANSEATGDAAPAVASNSATDRLKRKGKKYLRTNSKEAVKDVSPLPKYRSWKNSRRPRNGHGRGLPKKGGAGGKGVWGLPGSELLEEELLEDANDPNYDPEAVSNGDVVFQQVIVEADPEDVIRKSEPVILEYFEHGESAAAIEEFMEFITPKRTHIICETIIEIAFDHKPSHCEMASVLISDLYGRLLSAKDIGYAFERLLDRLPDLVLDTPDATVLLSNFIARSIADDCLPPKFIQQKHLMDLNPHAKQVIQRADTLLSMKHGLVRLDNIWGMGGGIRPVKALIRRIQLLLKEYLTSNDIAEAMRCVRELEVPHFHHELVYESVLLAIESMNQGVDEKLCVFLAELKRCVLVTPDEMDRGFTRVLEDMTDIAIDVPLAYIMLDRFVERCGRRFRLGDRVLSKMPTRGRKRFVSEGDGGAIKDHALKLRD